MTTALALRPRMPMPADAGVEASVWPVLTNALFPNAKTPEAIVLAVQYCKARNLDILKKPVNIVPVWDSKSGGFIEQIWPSINETQVTAARTGEWVGMDRPVFGPDITKTFTGRRRGRDGWADAEVTVTFPEWCEVTVYRFKHGERRAFTEPVWWLEAYARMGGSDLPTDMWVKRPRGQFVKVAKATSLRAAFPEEDGGAPDEDEVEIPTAPPAPEPPEQQKRPADNWRPPTDQSSARRDQQPVEHADEATSGGHEPPPHTEAPPQTDQETQATHGEEVDPTTGEVGPRAIEVRESEPWQDWGLRYLNALKTARTEEEVAAWSEKNETALNAMNEAAPKVYARLVAAAGKHLMTIKTPAQGGDDITIIGAG